MGHWIWVDWRIGNQGLVTDRTSYVTQAQDITIIECFEWKSAHAIADDRQNPVWLDMIDRYGKACEHVPLEELGESGQMFADFEAVSV